MSLKMEEATHQREWAASGMTPGSKETGSLFPQAHRTEFCQRDWACVYFSKCLFTHTCTHTHTYTHIQLTHTCMHTHVHTYKKYAHTLYTHVHTYTHTHTPSLHPLRASEKITYLSSHQIDPSGPQATVCRQSRMSFKGSQGLCLGDHAQTPMCFPKPLSHCTVRGVWCVGQE